MRTLAVLAATLTFAVVPDGMASEGGFAAGEWEIVRSITGGPRSAEPQSVRVCVTEAQLARSAVAPIELGVSRMESRQSCKVEQAGRTPDGGANAKLVCDGRLGQVKAELNGPASAADFNLTGDIKVALFSAEVGYSGRRLGECPA